MFIPRSLLNRQILKCYTKQIAAKKNWSLAEFNILQLARTKIKYNLYHLQNRIVMNTISKLLVCLLLSGASVMISAAELENLRPEQLQAMEQDHPLIIDIRTSKEWSETGIIPNSKKLQFFDAEGHFEPSQWLKKIEHLKQSSDQAIILVCRSGNRSSMVGNFLTRKLGMENVYHLQNGIQSWIKADLEVEK